MFSLARFAQYSLFSSIFVIGLIFLPLLFISPVNSLPTEQKVAAKSSKEDEVIIIKKRSSGVSKKVDKKAALEDKDASIATVFLVKFAINECRVPADCRRQVERALINEAPIRQHFCSSSNFPTTENNQQQNPSMASSASFFYEMLQCIDDVIGQRRGRTDMDSVTGRNCCENIDGASDVCREACRGALYAPTLAPERKRIRVKTLCNRQNGDETSGDRGLIKCLETTNVWKTKRFL